MLERRQVEQSLLAKEQGDRPLMQFRGSGARRKLAIDPRLSLYFRLKIEEAICEGVSRLLGGLLAQIVHVGDLLRSFAADLNWLGGKFADADDRAPDKPAAAAGGGSDAGAARRRSRRRTRGGNRLPHGSRARKRSAPRAGGDGGPGHPPIALSSAAPHRHAALIDILKEENSERMATPREDGDGGPVFGIAAGVEAALPALRRCGGSQRLLVAAPQSLASPSLVEPLRAGWPAPTVVASPDGAVMLCYEMEQIPLRLAAAEILDQRFRNVDLATRLHTRVDVNSAPM